jgi:ribosome-binding factor A
MSSRNRNRRRGSPDEELFFGASPDARHQRKDAQLCEQVAEALGFALGEDRDDDVASLQVVTVEPAPHVGHLAVLVAPAGETKDLAALLAKLEARSGLLRHEVAGAITRKRAPTLSFVIVPAGGREGEGER